MTTRLLTSEASRNARPDAIVVGIVQGTDGPGLAPGAEPTDEALGGALATALTALGATGRLEETFKIASAPLLGTQAGQAAASGSAVAPLIVAVGLGPHAPGHAKHERTPDFDPETLRRAAGAAVRHIVKGLFRAVQVENHAANGQGSGTYRIALALPARDQDEADAVALGGLLGGYWFSRYRTTVKAPPPIELMLAGGDPPATPRAPALADAIALVRDLVNTGPSDLVPATMAEVAERVAAEHGLDVEVLDEKELAEGGYGGIMAVGQGSVHPPRLVRLTYSHPDATKTVVFAGKGITFDSGGLSLKPPKAMEHMKSDMAGAAAVLGALQAIADLRPAVNVIGYLAAAENMPGGAAQRPASRCSDRRNRWDASRPSTSRSPRCGPASAFSATLCRRASIVVKILSPPCWIVVESRIVSSWRRTSLVAKPPPKSGRGRRASGAFCALSASACGDVARPSPSASSARSRAALAVSMSFQGEEALGLEIMPASKAHWARLSLLAGTPKKA